MSRSIIQTVNQSLQAVTAGSAITLGSVLRRKQIELNTLDYAISYIVSEQQGIHDKYKHKIEKIKL